MQSEAEVLHDVLLALGSRSDCKVWRNNYGEAKMPSGAWVRFGVPGQADVSGILRGGRRLEVETKRPRNHVHRKSQQRFQAMIEAMGGLYVLAVSADDAVRAVDSALAGRGT